MQLVQAARGLIINLRNESTTNPINSTTETMKQLLLHEKPASLKNFLKEHYPSRPRPD